MVGFQAGCDSGAVDRHDGASAEPPHGEDAVGHSGSGGLDCGAHDGRGEALRVGSVEAGGSGVEQWTGELRHAGHAAEVDECCGDIRDDADEIGGVAPVVAGLLVRVGYGGAGQVERRGDGGGRGPVVGAVADEGVESEQQPDGVGDLAGAAPSAAWRHESQPQGVEVDSVGRDGRLPCGRFGVGAALLFWRGASSRDGGGGPVRLFGSELVGEALQHAGAQSNDLAPGLDRHTSGAVDECGVQACDVAHGAGAEFAQRGPDLARRAERADRIIEREVVRQRDRAGGICRAGGLVGVGLGYLPAGEDQVPCPEHVLGGVEAC